MSKTKTFEVKVTMDVTYRFQFEGGWDEDDVERAYKDGMLDLDIDNAEEIDPHDHQLVSVKQV